MDLISDNITAIATVTTIVTFLASLLFGYLQGRRRKTLEKQLQYESSRRVAAEIAQSAASGGPVDLAELRRAQEARDTADFESNAVKMSMVEAVSFSGVGFFQDGTWQLQPGVNVLLGRNGYGKSLLLRELAAILSRSDRPTPATTAQGRLSVALRIGKASKSVARGPSGFEQSIGPVPVLAIPDSRFVNRSEDTLRPVPDPYASLARHGAYHFLQQLPYNTIVQGLLHSLCLDSFAAGRSLDLPIFRMLTKVFQELTDSSFRFHSIERVDPTGFRLNVLTEGNAEPVHIQAASQGTLSVLAVFGLVYRHLEHLASYDKSTATAVHLRRTIVIIDELDAHLHPSWQQRIGALLRNEFPNVQFIISAHSPLLVAGAGRGETSVMRKVKSRFQIQSLTDRDFIGATAADIYDTVFGVTDGEDEVFVEHSKLAASKVDHGPRIARLLEKKSRTVDEEFELRQLQQQDAYMRRAQAIEQNRADEARRLVQLETECSMLRIEVRELRAAREKDGPELSRLLQQSAAPQTAEPVTVERGEAT